MVWYRKPGFNRGFGRIVRQAFPLPELEDEVVVLPGDEQAGGGWFMASFTLTPIYESGSDTSDVYVGSVYVDVASTLRCLAFLGTTKTGTAVTLKVRDTYTATPAAATVATMSTTAALATVTDDVDFVVAQGTLLHFYLTCASAECSWQCPAIILVRQ